MLNRFFFDTRRCGIFCLNRNFDCGYHRVCVMSEYYVSPEHVLEPAVETFKIY